MSRYAAFCDEVFEVRNLRQWETFVERVATQPKKARRARRYSSTDAGTLPMFTT